MSVRTELVTDPFPPRILAAALTTLLLEAFEGPELAHLVSDGLRSELERLRADVEHELATAAGRRRPALHLAGEPHSG